MKDVSAASNRRARSVSVVGLVVQLIGMVGLLAVGIWSGSQAVIAGGRYMLGGALVWLVLILVFTQRKRSDLKDQEIEELKRSRAADPSLAIFELEEGSIERRRLAWMYRWLYPIATLLLAAYHILGSLFVAWNWEIGTALDNKVWKVALVPGPVMAVLAGVGFTCFLYSRYAAGMARQPEWRLIRAGASYLAGNALACLALVMAVALQAYEVPQGEPIIAHGIRILMLVLGFEFVVALVLNYYRPRMAGEESRPAFDSRLLEMISEPGGVARSIAEAINYQFGFEVTSTWFAQLLKRAFFPLVVLGLLSLLLLSSVVVVDAGEQAFVEHFGQLVQPKDQPLGPGLHRKWPWPIDCVYRTSVRRLRETMVGGTPKESPYDKDGRLKPLLWGQEHDFTYEMMTVVASPPQTEYDRMEMPRQGAGPGEAGDKSVAVSLMNVSVPIEYRVKNLYDYLYRYEEPDKLLEVIAFQALSDYAARVDIDTLMGAGRSEFCKEFHKQIQEEADRLRLGVDITFLALQDAHPPARGDVAKNFQAVVTAEMQRNTRVETARGEARQMLTMVAGNVERAEALVTAVRKRNDLEVDRGTSEVDRARAMLDVNVLLLGDAEQGIPRMSGQASQSIVEAQSRQTQQISDAESKARLFEAEVSAWEASPSLYGMRKYLDTLKRSLETIRKYVVTTDIASTNLIVIVESEKRNVMDIEDRPQ